MSDLVDAYGRPLVVEVLKKEQAGPTLAGIRNIYSIIDSSLGLTPERVVGLLRTAEFGDPWLYLELAERMEEKDLLYQGVLHTRKMAVSQLDIDVSAADDSRQSQQDANFIREVLIDSGVIDLHDVIFQMLDALGKGFSATEIMWDTDGRMKSGDPAWMPYDLKWRDPRWFMFDWVSGEQLLVRTLRTSGQYLPTGRNAWDYSSNPINFRLQTDDTGAQIGIQPATEPLAPFKFITHITSAKAGLPIRGGLARIAIWNYLFKNYVLKDWVTFAEVYGQPLRLGKYGPGADEADKTALLRAVANIGTDAAAIIPESMAIEFVESKGGGQRSHEMYEKFCMYLDKMLTIGILGQELTTQLPRGAGSRAAAQVHDVVRRDIATDDARRISASLNRDLIRPLIDLNLGPRRQYPAIVVGYKGELDQANFVEWAGNAADHGLKISQKWVREQLTVPDPAPYEDLLHPKESISAKVGNGDGGEGAGAIADTPLTLPYTGIGNGNGNGHHRTLHHKQLSSSRDTGNPEAVGVKLQFKGGSKPFQKQVQAALAELPVEYKNLLKGWTVKTVDTDSGDHVGLTNPNNHTITVGEKWPDGSMIKNPSQVVRHEVNHVFIQALRNAKPQWCKTFLRTIEHETEARRQVLQDEDFEYMLKSPEEAACELLSVIMPHEQDSQDRHYAKLKDILPQAWSAAADLLHQLGHRMSAAAMRVAQKKKPSNTESFTTETTAATFATTRRHPAGVGRLLTHARHHLLALAESAIPYIVAQFEHYQRQHPKLFAEGKRLPRDLSLGELDPLSLSHFRALSGDIMPTMQRTFTRRGMQVLKDFGVEASLHLVDRRAVRYAQERGAELVKDLTDSTRNMVHDTVVKALEERWSAGQLARELRTSEAFSPARALRIARSEIQMSFRAGGREAASEAGANTKAWNSANDACDLCQENAEASPIAIDEEWPNGDYPHPSCTCDESFSQEPTE